MKAEELMIGDWVKVTRYRDNGNDIIRQVRGVGEECVLIDDDRGLNPQYNDHIEPIPLTPEILEKNGFSWGLTTNQEDMLGCGLGVPVTAEKSWVWEDEDGGEGVVCINFPNEADGGQIWCDNNGKCISLIWDSDIAVHELQRALRCCGLFDLANNLKIE